MDFKSLNCCKLPSILKRANVSPVLKKSYRGSKENRPLVSILPVKKKIFEKVIKQTNYSVCRSKSSKISVRLKKRFQCTVFLSSNTGEMERCG